MSTRFLRIHVPSPIDTWLGFTETVVLNEGPRDNGFAEIRLATDAEVGLWTRKALPPPRGESE